MTAENWVDDALILAVLATQWKVFQRLDRIDAAQRSIATTMKEIKDTMATQADIDAITAQLATVSTGLDEVQTALTGIRQDIADLKAANPGVDTSALEASVTALSDKLSSVVADASELDSETPTP